MKHCPISDSYNELLVRLGWSYKTIAPSINQYYYGEHGMKRATFIIESDGILTVEKLRPDFPAIAIWVEDELLHIDLTLGDLLKLSRMYPVKLECEYGLNYLVLL